jgi:hypothetical protein
LTYTGSKKISLDRLSNAVDISNVLTPSLPAFCEAWRSLG